MDAKCCALLVQASQEDAFVGQTNGCENAGAHLCGFLYKASMCLCFFSPFSYVNSPQGQQSGTSSQRVSLQEHLIHEPVGNAAPVLLHNVTIKASASGTPGGRGTEKEKEK